MFLSWIDTTLPLIDCDRLTLVYIQRPTTNNIAYRIMFKMNTEENMSWDFNDEANCKIAYKNVVKTLINLGLAVNCAKPNESIKQKSNRRVKIVSF